MKHVYRCSVCNKEYPTENEAIKCEQTKNKKHSFSVGSVVRIRTTPICSSYTALIIEKDGYEGHVPQYKVDPRNGLCFYQINESQIVECIFSAKEYEEKEKVFDEYKRSIETLTKKYFGHNVKINDDSMLLWDKNKIAKIKFYINE